MDNAEQYRREADLILGDLERQLEGHAQDLCRWARKAGVSPAVILRYALRELSLDEFESIVREAEAST